MNKIIQVAIDSPAAAGAALRSRSHRRRQSQEAQAAQAASEDCGRESWSQDPEGCEGQARASRAEKQAEAAD